MPINDDSLRLLPNRATVEAVDPEKWLDLHGNLLYRFALARVQDQHTAEDLVQDTLLSAISAYEYFESKSSVQTWLVGILRNKIADYFKRANRIRSSGNYEAILPKLLDSSVSTSEFKSLVERSEFASAFKNCFQRLPVAMAETFLSRFRDECSVDELSRKLEISKSNVSVRLFRARLMLRSCLERVWLGEPVDKSQCDSKK